MDSARARGAPVTMAASGRSPAGGGGETRTPSDAGVLPLARTPLYGQGTDVPRPPKKRALRYTLVGVLVAGAIGGASLGLGRLRAAAPSVDGGTLWMDTVKRGPMVREVLGQGTLVPEQIRWIPAKTSARVERVLVKPGAVVELDTILVELTNTDVELAALEAERAVAEAEAQLANLMASLDGQRLAQESVIATLGSELSDARRRAEADEALSNQGFLPDLELAQTRERATELAGRVAFEKKRLSAQEKGIAAQVTAQKAQLGRMRAIAEFRRQEVEDLKVRAGVAGVLQELPLAEGQAVAAGALLAKVARPDRLQAEIRVPETQANDLRIGLRASIDTRNGVIPGHVSRIDPAAQAGTVRVDVTLDGALPPGARPDLNVEGIIEIERLADVLYVGRPAFGQPEGTVGLWKLSPDGEEATRVSVKLGSSSVKSVEIKAGLREGDKVILSDMSEWDEVDRVRLR